MSTDPGWRHSNSVLQQTRQQLWRDVRQWVDTINLQSDATPGNTMTEDVVVSSAELIEYGLGVAARSGITGSLEYERPAFLHAPKGMRHCRLGAFSYVNGGHASNLYHADLGRYCQIAEDVIIGPPEHPTDWFSTHPFAFTRPNELPKMYRLPEFARLAPEQDSDAVHYFGGAPLKTRIGNEVWVGAGALVRRGVTVGDGAIIGAKSLVLEDVPPYAIVAGVPARVIRLRFDEALVARFMALQWWRFDLAPYKHTLDFSQAEACLARLEQLAADGALSELATQAYRVEVRGEDQFAIRSIAALGTDPRADAPSTPR